MSELKLTQTEMSIIFEFNANGLNSEETFVYIPSVSHYNEINDPTI